MVNKKLFEGVLMSEVFAFRLKCHLEDHNIQQKTIASTLKVSPAVFSAWMKCKSEPSLDMLAKICKELSISADYLIGLRDSKSLPVTTPVSIAPVSIPRQTIDPFEDLTPEQRSAIELSLKAFREANAAKAQEA